MNPSNAVVTAPTRGNTPASFKFFMSTRQMNPEQLGGDVGNNEREGSTGPRILSELTASIRY
jgi:hypothetical protein